MSTLVVTFFTSSDAYKTDINIANESLELISSCDGVLENYHGFAIENSSVGATVQLATNPEAFKAVVDNKELFDKILEKGEVARVGAVEQYYTVPVSDPKNALCGPVTEFYVASLKDPKNRKDFEIHAGALNKITGGKWTYGWSGEDNNKTIIVGAWKSLEAHRKQEALPGVHQFLQQLVALLDTEKGPFHFYLMKV